MNLIESQVILRLPSPSGRGYSNTEITISWTGHRRFTNDLIPLIAQVVANELDSNIAVTGYGYDFYVSPKDMEVHPQEKNDTNGNS